MPYWKLKTVNHSLSSSKLMSIKLFEILTYASQGNILLLYIEIYKLNK